MKFTNKAKYYSSQIKSKTQEIIYFIYLFVEKDYEITKDKSIKYKIILISWIPTVYLLFYMHIWTIQKNELGIIQYLLICLSSGLITAIINNSVAHELCHKSKVEKLLAYVMLMLTCNMYFPISHNQGHHKNVGTENDYSTAKLNESVYSFVGKSVKGQIKLLWKKVK